MKRWQAIAQADDAEQFATFKKRIEQFVEFRAELVRRANEISPAAGREWGDNDANRSSPFGAEQGSRGDVQGLYRARQAHRAHRTKSTGNLSFVLTCLGGLALLLVVVGVVIIARSIARPLSVITATIKQVAQGAENVEVPHTARGDEIGALARAIRIFQEAMERNRNLNSQVTADSAARAERSRHIESSVEEFRGAIGAVLNSVHQNASAMRQTAESITRVTSDASQRAMAATGATTQAAGNVAAVASAAEELSASVQEIGCQSAGPRARGRADRPAHRKVGHRNREPRRGHATDRRRAAS